MADETLRELVRSLSSSTSSKSNGPTSSTPTLPRLSCLKRLRLPCLEIKDKKEDIPSQLREMINVDPSNLERVPDALLRSLTCSFETVLELRLEESFGGSLLKESTGLVSYKASKTYLRTLPACHDVGDAVILPQILTSTIEIEVRTRLLPPTSMAIRLTGPGFAKGVLSSSGSLDSAAIEIDALLLHQSMVTQCNQVIYRVQRDLMLQANLMGVVEVDRLRGDASEMLKMMGPHESPSPSRPGDILLEPTGR